LEKGIYLRGVDVGWLRLRLRLLLLLSGGLFCQFSLELLNGERSGLDGLSHHRRRRVAGMGHAGRHLTYAHQQFHQYI
jgi:hypothetical protein